MSTLNNSPGGGVDIGPNSIKTVLVVDDEKPLCDLLCNVLQGLGYKTVSTTNPKEAINILKAESDINLLITDVIMHDMNGYQVAIAAHQMNPALKIILSSGFVEKPPMKATGYDDLIKLLDLNRLKKPYTIDDVEQAIYSSFNGTT